MFGYIRPVTTELKVRELDAFKACYCGLCHVMGNEFGFFSRFLLNYDFVYLAMLLWDKETEVEFEAKRCIGCPYKKKKCCKPNDALKKSAALSIILSWWKIQDEIQDEGFLKSTLYRFVGLFIKKAYKKAAELFSEYDESVRKNLAELSKLEKEKCTSIDAAADCFAKILSMASAVCDENKSRVLEQILYHTGRWIYIIDACDDFEDDIKSGRFNAVASRFEGITVLNDDAKQRLRTTLLHSRNLAGSAFELMDETPWSDTVRNIIFLSMPAVSEAVISGQWKEIGKFKNFKIGI